MIQANDNELDWRFLFKGNGVWLHRGGGEQVLTSALRSLC